MRLSPDELAARYDDVYRKAERVEIDAERFDRALKRGDDSFEFHFATFFAEPTTTVLAADPGRPGEGIDEAAWRTEVPENTFDRELVARLARRFK